MQSECWSWMSEWSLEKGVGRKIIWIYKDLLGFKIIQQVSTDPEVKALSLPAGD